MCFAIIYFMNELISDCLHLSGYLGFWVLTMNLYHKDLVALNGATGFNTELNMYVVCITSWHMLQQHVEWHHACGHLSVDVPYFVTSVSSCLSLSASSHNSKLPVQPWWIHRCGVEQQITVWAGLCNSFPQHCVLVRQYCEVFGLQLHDQVYRHGSHLTYWYGAAPELHRLSQAQSQAGQWECKSGIAVCLQSHRTADYQPIHRATNKQVSVCYILFSITTITIIIAVS